VRNHEEGFLIAWFELMLTYEQINSTNKKVPCENVEVTITAVHKNKLEEYL
jgi:hypothetical protein